MALSQVRQQVLLLIASQIWSYPHGNVLGTYWLIPIEEYFFFMIQTYITSCLYMLLSKPLIRPLFITEDSLKVGTCTGVWLAVASTIIGAIMVYYGNRVLYIGLLLTWASPVLALLMYPTFPQYCHESNAYSDSFVVVIFLPCQLWSHLPPFSLRPSGFG